MMKYIKEYKEIDWDNDDFDIEEKDPDGTFIMWLKEEFSHKSEWSEIRSIYCYDENLDTLEGIQELINLREIDFEGNDIISISPLINLIKLTDLNCGHNKLSTLDGIDKLKNLKILNCANNLLTTIDGLETLDKLELLLVEDNNFDTEYVEYLLTYCDTNNIDIII